MSARHYTINVGLEPSEHICEAQSKAGHLGCPTKKLRQMVALAELQLHGFAVSRYSIAHATLRTEETLVIEIETDSANYPALVFYLFRMAYRCQQDCVALFCWETHSGELIGSRAHTWGAFNPDLCTIHSRANSGSLIRVSDLHV